MKHSVIFIGILISIIGVLSGHAQQKGFPVLKGPYLGQKLPGMTPEVFAPGIISIKEGKEYKITFSPNLQEIYFTRRTPHGRNDRLWHSRLENGKLTIPKLAPFSYDCLESNAILVQMENGCTTVQGNHCLVKRH